MERHVSNAVQLRMQKELAELELPHGVRLELKDPDDLLELELFIEPEEGWYAGGCFGFAVRISADYPFSPPSVRCRTAVWHPNIEVGGAVCLNILREDWSPVLSLASVMFGLLLLFYDPNPAEPLNKAAADQMQEDPVAFAAVVHQTMRGGSYFGHQFPKLI